jgi:hypothetical protein
MMGAVSFFETPVTVAVRTSNVAQHNFDHKRNEISCVAQRYRNVRKVMLEQ